MTHNSLARTLSFEDILDALERLGREHLLFYRVQVGELFLQQFWRGDAAHFSRSGPNKGSRFELFFAKHAEILRRYGLSPRQARDSVRAAIVVRTLPPAVAKQLFLSQVLALTRLRDPTQRAQVATAAVANDWSVQELQQAVSAVHAGLPLDSDAEQPGVQITQVPPRQPVPVPGRMVNRAERFATDVDDWALRWQQVDASRLKPVHRQRLVKALSALEDKVAALRRGLEGD